MPRLDSMIIAHAHRAAGTVAIAAALVAAGEMASRHGEKATGWPS